MNQTPVLYACPRCTSTTITASQCRGCGREDGINRVPLFAAASDVKPTPPPVALPSWFRPVTGFSFADSAGDHYIVVGVGRFMTTETIGNVHFNGELASITNPATGPRGLVAVMCYRGDFTLIELGDKDAEFWADCSPVEDKGGLILVLEDNPSRASKQTWSIGVSNG